VLQHKSAKALRSYTLQGLASLNHSRLDGSSKRRQGTLLAATAAAANRMGSATQQQLQRPNFLVFIQTWELAAAPVTLVLLVTSSVRMTRWKPNVLDPTPKTETWDPQSRPLLTGLLMG
jgi:hypothetical protein